MAKVRQEERPSLWLTFKNNHLVTCRQIRCFNWLVKTKLREQKKRILKIQKNFIHRNSNFWSKEKKYSRSNLSRKEIRRFWKFGFFRYQAWWQFWKILHISWRSRISRQINPSSIPDDIKRRRPDLK